MTILCALACALAGLASAQATLRITAPPNETVVRPGQSVTIEVSASGERLESAALLGKPPFGYMGTATTPPYRFKIVIPQKIDSGPYGLSAVGTTISKVMAADDTVIVDVERAESPVNLRAQDFPDIRMHVGNVAFSAILGLFGDGTTAKVTDSTFTTFSSENPSVATVERNGLVKGLVPGSTKIVVTNGKARLEIPVTILRNDEN